jgi:2'-5' RNA ligase
VRVVGTSGDAASADVAVGDAAGSGLIIPLPVAEQLIGGWRATLDPAAAAGVPAHITIHFPWVPADLVDKSVLHDVAEMVWAVPRFEVAFHRIAWFDREVLWLEPDPQRPFIALAAESARRWPDHPQYGGMFETVVPHLTVGVGDPGELERAEAGLSEVLPIHETATQVWWMTRTGVEPWVVRDTFDLG